MKANKSIRFEDEMLVQLEALASSRNMTLAGVVRTACEVYLMRQELASELNEMEARLAASLLRGQKETVKVSEDVQLLIALLDQMAQFLFITTPDVIDKEAAAANGLRRHAAFISELHKVFSTKRKKAGITEALEKMEGGDGNLSK